MTVSCEDKKARGEKTLRYVSYFRGQLFDWSLYRPSRRKFASSNPAIRTRHVFVVFFRHGKHKSVCLQNISEERRRAAGVLKSSRNQNPRHERREDRVNSALDHGPHRDLQYEYTRSNYGHSCGHAHWQQNTTKLGVESETLTKCTAR